MTELRSPPPTDEEREEAGFTRVLLSNPADVTARLAFADWLEEHGRWVQARYLREVRAHKFVRLVRARGGWALTPEFSRPLPPKVPASERYDYVNTLPLTPSPRFVAMVNKIQRGWRPPKWTRTLDYSPASGYFGVYVAEYLYSLAPLLGGLEEEAREDRLLEELDRRWRFGDSGAAE